MVKIDISGLPGTGKTACVQELLKELGISGENKQKDSEILPIWVNAMSLSEPEEIYKHLLKKMQWVKGNIESRRACTILDSVFRKGCLPEGKKLTVSQKKTDSINQIKILVIDEIDYLVTKTQDVLYNIFEWPQHKKTAKLVVIGIANTMDFPEKLDKKIKSRIGNERIIFGRYTSEQIEIIIRSRIESVKIFEADAINYLSKKIAKHAADVRKALHLCRTAIEICKNEFLQSGNSKTIKVSIDHIDKAHQSVQSNPVHKCIASLGDFDKLILIAMALDLKSVTSQEDSHQSEVNLPFQESQIFERVLSMINTCGKSYKLSKIDFNSILNNLRQLNIISIKEQIGKRFIQTRKQIPNNPNLRGQGHFIDQKLVLNYKIDDIICALKNDALFMKFSELF